MSGYHSFEEVLQNGICVRGTAMHCYVLKGLLGKPETPPLSGMAKAPAGNNELPVRVGFAVPKKLVPLAVDRNRIKRLLREAFRKNKEQLYTLLHTRDSRISIVVMYRAGASPKKLSYADIEREWKEIIPKIIAAA
ncbi:MAG: ribonuclease P protein component [Bacteroidota bacterium]|nr:ribonuclease P protein component [Bacteroidota bacterium]